ncbi:MAG TPA: ABC transporter permease [Terriglobales bacterium]|jgi:predicted permease|nr:ABC transporter permease [Terriglobales bacterium]
MRWSSKLRLRLRSLFQRDAVERELDSELRFHLEEQIAENIASGMKPDEAKYAASRAMGGITQIAEQCREARNVGLVETTWHDLRFGARMLAKNPAFSTVAVLTLAVGIGFNTMSFSAVTALLFGGLPVKDPDRLVLGEALREGFDPAGTSQLQYTVLRGEQKAFASTALSIDRSFLLRGNTEAEQVHVAAVSPGFFETLGTAPILGRDLSREESRPGGPAAVLLAYGFWQRRFGGDPNVIGQSLVLDDRSYSVVGVMPPGFDYPTRTQAWVALEVDPETAPMQLRTAHGSIFVARLREGVSLLQAAQASKESVRHLEQQFPTERGWSYGLLTMRQWSIGDDDGRMTRAIVVLVLAIGLLLLICCVNVANLLLVRGVVREGELAIRVALGASSWRIAQQLLTEGAMLAFVGGAAGLLLAWGMRPVFRMLNPIQPHSFGEVATDFRMDTRVFIFCFTISILSGLMFSLLPTLKLVKLRNVIAMLRQREHRVGGTAARRGWLRALVVAEIAIAVSLSFGGALLTKSFYGLAGLDLGFRPEHLLTMQLPLSVTEYPHETQKVAFLDRVLERVRALPGVEAAGVTTSLPMQEFSPDTVFTVEGRPPRNPSDVPITALRHVSPGYAETLGLMLLEGRMITAEDRADTLPVAVITEEMARQAFGDGDPIGKRLRRGRQQDTIYPWLVVVGVVRDAKEDRLNFRIARPVLYIPYAQRTNPPSGVLMGLVVRTTADPSVTANFIRTSIHDINPYEPVLDVSSMDAMLNSVLSSDRFSARVMAMLAAVGLFLAAIGLYSVIAYSVTQRTGEIGLRMALGAQPRSVIGLIAREGGALVGFGLVVSLPFMFVVARLLSSVLFSVSAGDPAILLGIVLLLTFVALTACFVPTMRAIRLDPLRALRCE